LFRIAAVLWIISGVVRYSQRGIVLLESGDFAGSSPTLILCLRKNHRLEVCSAPPVLSSA
jgi:hypothetical protein